MRQGAAEQLVEQHAQRIEVAAPVNGQAGQLFGRHEGRRAQHEAGARAAAVAQAGDAEVHQLEAAVDAVQHHVGGLDVAVDHALAVRIGQRAGQAYADLHHLAHRQQLAGPGEHAEVAAESVFEGDPGIAAVLAGVHHMQDVRVVESARSAGLAHEALTHVGEVLGRELAAQRQALDGDLPAGGALRGLVDDGHRATAQLGAEGVVLQPGGAAGWAGGRRVGRRVAGEGRRRIRRGVSRTGHAADQSLPEAAGFAAACHAADLRASRDCSGARVPGRARQRGWQC
mmetsp:Transcript_33438/g.54237  ORF Transcript_33438/g.54237 Transcript_33438/m.54237 type:complete len:285 (-) Transcript_33438:93-947(-)